MARKAGVRRRTRGSIRRRGGTYQVRVYGGVDPLTGQDIYVTGSTRNERQAEKIRTELLAQVDQGRHAATKATFGYVLDSWLGVHDVEESTRDTYRWYVEQVIRPALGDLPIKKLSMQIFERFYAHLRRCRDRCNGKPYLEHRTAEPHECRAVRHRWPPHRPSARDRARHNCETAGCTVVECQPHVCEPMSASSIRQTHFIMSSALELAVRWEWIPHNPAAQAKKPRRPAPEPDPPTPEEAARIAEAAWAQDDEWGTLVWLVMMTGARRGEIAALRWFDLHLKTGVLEIRRAYGRRAGKAVEKGTKTHQMRRVSLDPTTILLLTEHKNRYKERVKALGDEPSENAHVFSYTADHSRPCSPDALTHRYRRMCNSLGIDTHLHSLRHFTATELIAAGVDIRTVAGRLGHGGGGTTTLQVYAAWVDESDKRAADILAGRVAPPRNTKQTPANVVPLRGRQRQ